MNAKRMDSVFLIFYDGGYDGMGVLSADGTVCWGPDSEGEPLAAYPSQETAEAAIDALREEGRRTKKGSLARDLYVLKAALTATDSPEPAYDEPEPADNAGWMASIRDESTAPGSENSDG